MQEEEFVTQRSNATVGLGKGELWRTGAHREENPYGDFSKQFAVGKVSEVCVSGSEEGFAWLSMQNRTAL